MCDRSTKNRSHSSIASISISQPKLLNIVIFVDNITQRYKQLSSSAARFFWPGIDLKLKGSVNADFLCHEVSWSFGHFSGMRTHVMAMSE
jgi:hypothetical protein